MRILRRNSFIDITFNIALYSVILLWGENCELQVFDRYKHDTGAD